MRLETIGLIMFVVSISIAHLYMLWTLKPPVTKVDAACKNMALLGAILMVGGFIAN